MSNSSSKSSFSFLPPGQIWSQVKIATQSAIQSGALQSIPTAYELIEQDGIQFLVRILTNLICKEKAQKSDESFNPFLPYEKALFVGDITETHLCLLNKFNVVDYHLLMITRQFEEQESWLNLQDFLATAYLLREVDGLVFYNGGKKAGASQRHKHLQLVPLPLTPSGFPLPIYPLFSQAIFSNSYGIIPLFPFLHGLLPLAISLDSSPQIWAESIYECYERLLHNLGLKKDANSPTSSSHQPYNLLLTRQWMLIIPRSAEKFAEIGINSLGFAGALLVRNQTELQLLKDLTPLGLLQKVTQPQ